MDSEVSKSEDQKSISEVRIRYQRSDIRGQISEVRYQRSDYIEVENWVLKLKLFF